MEIELTKESNVRDLVELYNNGKIKYQNIMDLFGVSRDLIKSRMIGIGLNYDNSEKKFLGDATKEDLDTQLSTLFVKQRGNQFTKNSIGKANVSTNETKEPINNTNHRSNVVERRAKEEIIQANEQVAPTIEPITSTKERTNVIRKRSSFDIDVDLMKDLKIQAIMHDKNVYEIVETAIRKELAEMKKD